MFVKSVSHLCAPTDPWADAKSKEGRLLCKNMQYRMFILPKRKQKIHNKKKKGDLVGPAAQQQAVSLSTKVSM
jgi:hypothetical protein